MALIQKANIELVNINTGQVGKFVHQFNYKDPDIEKTKPEYLVDDTGYVTLEQQIERCFREGRIKEFGEGQFSATGEEILAMRDDDDELSPDIAGSASTAGDASSEVAVDNSSQSETQIKGDNQAIESDSETIA